jgi:AmpE protein
MKLLVILLCLFSERFLIHAMSYRRFFWFVDYHEAIKKRLEGVHFSTHPWVMLAFIVLPLILGTAFIYWLLCGIFFGIIGLLLNIMLFFYCLGPQNVFYPVTQSEIENSEQLSGNYFALVNHQLFSVVFWYIVAGPIGIVTYRIITLCNTIPEVSIQANEVTDLLEWIPARLTGLLFLMVGNFQGAFKCYSSYFFAKPDYNNELLRQCGLQAVRMHETEEVTMVAAQGLVDHAIILMLVFVALFSLVSGL